MAGAGERCARHPAHSLLVVDDEDTRDAPGVSLHIRGCALLGPRRNGRRRRDGERRAFSRGRVDGDGAPHARNDAIHVREPEARALAARLRREEGLEDAFARPLVHAGAGVAHTQHDEVGRASRPDRQLAAVRHRITGVDSQVDENLFELDAVCPQRKRVRRDDRLDLDVRADETAQHSVDHVLHELVQIELVVARLARPRKREQLARELGRALGCRPDLVHPAARLGRQLRRAEQEHVPADDGEEIVEVMSDTAREAADRVHLLLLADLRLELSSFGDRLVDGHRVERRPVVIADDGYSDTHRRCHSTLA